MKQPLKNFVQVFTAKFPRTRYILIFNNNGIIEGVMFKKAFQVLKLNLLFIQPLLLYILMISSSFVYIVNKNIVIFQKGLIAISALLLTAAFLSGWFYINRLAVQDYKQDEEKEITVEKSIKNFKQFFTGVGVKFLNYLLAVVIFTGLYIASVMLISKFCINNFGIPEVLKHIMSLSGENYQNEIMNYLNSVPDTDKLVFIKWMLILTVYSVIVNFLGVLYFSVLSYDKNNALTSIWYTIKFFITQIAGCVKVIAVLLGIYMLINMSSLLFGVNSISYILIIILFTLYLNYYVLLVLCFYDEKTNNSDSGTECIG